MLEQTAIAFLVTAKKCVMGAGFSDNTPLTLVTKKSAKVRL